MNFIEMILKQIMNSAANFINKLIIFKCTDIRGEYFVLKNQYFN